MCGIIRCEKDVPTVTIATSEYGSLKARQAELEALVRYYESQLKLTKHRQFGSSSEKSELPEQLSLFDEAENTTDPGQPEPELEEINYKRSKSKIIAVLRLLPE